MSKKRLHSKRTASLALLAAGIVAVSILGVGLPAYAAGTYPTLANSNIRSQPTTSSSILKTVPKGTRLTIDCYMSGQAVSGVTIWNHLTSGGYISDTLLLTGSNRAVVPACLAGLPVIPIPVPPAPKPVAYNRQAAVNWARAHVNDKETFTNDNCTWFVTQALWTGGLPQTAQWTGSTLDLGLVASKAHYPGPTKAAATADVFKNYILGTGRATIRELSWKQNNLPDAQLGDIIAYDWGHPDGKGGLAVGVDGVIDHLMIVTSLSGQYPNVTGQSRATPSTGWTWSAAYNNWWEIAYASPLGAPRAYLIHITY